MTKTTKMRTNKKKGRKKIPSYYKQDSKHYLPRTGSTRVLLPPLETKVHAVVAILSPLPMLSRVPTKSRLVNSLSYPCNNFSIAPDRTVMPVAVVVS